MKNGEQKIWYFSETLQRLILLYIFLNMYLRL
jgi:hypothetical protein